MAVNKEHSAWRRSVWWIDYGVLLNIYLSCTISEPLFWTFIVEGKYRTLRISRTGWLVPVPPFSCDHI